MWHVLLAQVWTHSLFFTFSNFKVSKFDNVNTLRAQLIFPLKLNFCNLFEFTTTRSTQKSISFTPLPRQLWNKLVKSDLSRAFQQGQEHLQIPIQFSLPTLFSFHWENDSIINSFHTVAPNNPSQCTFIHP
jgi:hypothetical protein